MEREDYIREIRELAQLTISLQKKIEEKKSEIKSTTMKLESLDKEKESLDKEMETLDKKMEHIEKGLAERDKLNAWLTAKKKRLEKEILRYGRANRNHKS